MSVGEIHYVDDDKCMVISQEGQTLTLRSFKDGSLYTVGAEPEPKKDVLDVGRIGDGPFKTGGEHRGMYKRWYKMMYRCYITEDITQITGVEVVPEWHDYQVYAQWFVDACAGLEDSIHTPRATVKRHRINADFGPANCFVNAPEAPAPYKPKPKPKTKKYTYYYKGAKLVVKDIDAFCEYHGLSRRCMVAVHNGNYKSDTYKGYSRYLESYSVVSQGEVITITGLYSFCKQHGLRYETMHKLCTGKRKTAYKGFSPVEP
ncbi:hypothetical protein [Vibrio agarivorans]|uniref:hypothetical protein n=1 Tax=Vibrio agarivorans TaxID=153622 RepID=UPI0025B3F4DC|nr:hypothetical protein [Vibrio agarivorans]MDN3659955.1 hypothetical protein [Vibrio agarivorans]